MPQDTTNAPTFSRYNFLLRFGSPKRWVVCLFIRFFSHKKSKRENLCITHSHSFRPEKKEKREKMRWIRESRATMSDRHVVRLIVRFTFEPNDNRAVDIIEFVRFVVFVNERRPPPPPPSEKEGHARCSVLCETIDNVCRKLSFTHLWHEQWALFFSLRGIEAYWFAHEWCTAQCSTIPQSKKPFFYHFCAMAF